MKKNIAHNYEKQNGVKFITAVMASESIRRATTWLKNGCNAFNSKNPKSTPMAFWTEQDVLAYAYQNNIQLASPYGRILKEGVTEKFEKLGLFDEGTPIFSTELEDRTGCYTCGFGVHLEKDPNRLCRMDRKLRDATLQGGRFEDGLWVPYRGYGFYFVYEWMNKYGGLHIQIPDREKYFEQLPSKAKEMLR